MAIRVTLSSLLYRLFAFIFVLKFQFLIFNYPVVSRCCVGIEWLCLQCSCCLISLCLLYNLIRAVYVATILIVYFLNIFLIGIPHVFAYQVLMLFTSVNCIGIGLCASVNYKRRFQVTKYYVYKIWFMLFFFFVIILVICFLLLCSLYREF